MEAMRLPALLRSAVSPASISRIRLFSSSPAAAQRARHFFCDDISSEESAVYQHALKFQQPSTLQHTPQIHNSVSCIGTVDFPFSKVNTSDGKLGLYTFLNVSTSSACKASFKIMLKMWDDMAELSMKHIRGNNLIYVRGHLQSYVKDGQKGKPWVFHEIIVKEINFVSRHDKASTCQESKKTELFVSDEDRLERRNSRLYLWQVFLSNPHEWWDNRENKVNSKGPDFKHKHTGEALWFHRDDPPWIRRQVQLLDCRRAGKHTENLQVSPFTYD